MTQSSETWLSQRLHDGANTLPVPPDLTDDVVGHAIKVHPRSKRVHSVMQIAAAVTVMAVVVVGVNVLRSDNPSTSTPAATPTPVNTAAPVTDTAAALLGTWELVSWEGEPVPPRRGMHTVGATFQTDGTWDGSDGCNLLNGTYRVKEDGMFYSTTNLTTYAACPGMTLPAMPAEGAVQVSVDNDTATFLDASDAQVAKYRRPGGAVAAEARLVTRLGDPALALSTYGSGSCPTRMESISLEANNQLVVNLADSSSQVCTADLRRSTDVMTIPGRLDLGAPITARLIGTGARFNLTLLVDSSALDGEPKLVTAQDWDGSSVELARLEGVLGINDQGCVTVGDTVVLWPNTYYLVTDRADTWAIATTEERYGPGYMNVTNVLAAEGERVILAGSMTPFDVSPGPLPGATHSECLLDDDYWTGIIEVQG